MSSGKPNAQSQAQGKAEEWMESAKSTAIQARDVTVEAASATQEKAINFANATKEKAVEAANATQEQATNAANATKEKAAEAAKVTQEKTQQKDQTPGFFQQTGNQVVNMAQGALDGVKNTFGVGDQKK